eukprot:6192392-Pleurochrysis_carterae.AAC.3
MVGANEYGISTKVRHPFPVFVFVLLVGGYTVIDDDDDDGDETPSATSDNSADLIGDGDSAVLRSPVTLPQGDARARSRLFVPSASSLVLKRRLACQSSGSARIT